ncbi:MAG: hypothetical protein ACKOXK_11740 [Chakrabartia sp.]
MTMMSQKDFAGSPPPALDLPALDLDAHFAGDEPTLFARIARWAGPILSVAMLVAILTQARGVDYRQLLTLPTQPLFWAAWAISYLATPVSEWIIYRRLWTIPPDGLIALLKKQVSNELLLGYLGDAQFYLWARARTDMTGTPFAAVKDVSILSAMAGNAATLLLLLVSWPYLAQAQVGVEMRTILVSLGVMLASSILVFAFRKRLFSLPRASLYFVTAVHLARIAVGLAVLALAWSLLLPGLAFSWLLLLAMLRMLVSRLPLLPNKDIVFAALTMLLLGANGGVGTATTQIAVITLAGHIAIGLAILVRDGALWRRGAAQ